MSKLESEIEYERLLKSVIEQKALIKQLVEALEYSVYCIVSDGTHSADMPKAALHDAKKAGF